MPRLLVVALALAACTEQQDAGRQETPPAEPETQPTTDAGASGRDSIAIDGEDAASDTAAGDADARRDNGDVEMAWRFSTTAAGPKLAYGQPQTDNVRLNLRCDGEQVTLHFMRSAEVVGRSPDQLTVASGGAQWRTDVAAEESQLGGMSISASAPASSAPMTAFGSGRPLEVRWGEETIRVPGTDKARQFLSACG